jgi:hypothetical protein
MTTTPRPPIRTATPPSDTVQWNDHVSAPIFIPITAAVVFACIVLLCIIKCLKSLWDKKKRSDAYEITDLIHEKDTGRAGIPALDQNHDLDTPDHPNLNLVNYSGEKRFRRRSLDFDVESGDGSDSRPASGNGMIRIEAKVHDSSNENNDYDEPEESEAPADQHLLHMHNNHHNDSNHSSNVPIVVGLETKALRHNNAPLAPTESEV